MGLDQSALLELLEMMRSAGDGDLMRRLLGTMLQTLVDAEATAFIGAEPHERSETRTTQRNGTRDKTIRTIFAQPNGTKAASSSTTSPNRSPASSPQLRSCSPTRRPT